MKNVKAPNIVIVGVITVITIVLWIIFGVYKLLTTPQDVDVPSEVIAPLSPALDQESLSSLEQRIFFTESEVSDITLINSPEPEETPTPSPNPSPTPQEEDQEEATQSAEQEEATGSGEVSQ